MGNGSYCRLLQGRRKRAAACFSDLAPSTFKTKRFTTQRTSVSTLRVAAKTRKLMGFLYLKFSIRDMMEWVYICAPDTLDVLHVCLCLAHDVVTSGA